MNDRSYINATLSKLKSALAMQRCAELETVLNELRANGSPAVRGEKDTVCTVKVKWTDANGTCHSFFLEGYRRPTQAILKTNDITVDHISSPETEKAFLSFERDQRMLNNLSEFMTDTDMVDVKKNLPELKPFMTLVEKERKEAKEKENAEWRRTYETCIELFGDDARG